MFNKINRYWRIFATGLSFTLFGLGGVLLRILVFPLLHVLIRDRHRRIIIARTIIRLSFRFFIGLMVFLGILRYQIIGLERLNRSGLLILANHPTLLDTVFLMAFVKNAGCIVKHHLRHNPFTHGPVKAAGYIDNEQGTELVTACINSLQEGTNLIIFPEGTRTPANGTIELKRGAANIAVRAGRAVTPVHIQCKPPSLSKGEPWWQVPERQMRFEIEVKEDIHIEYFTGEGQSDVMAARRLTQYLQDYYIKECHSHA